MLRGTFGITLKFSIAMPEKRWYIYTFDVLLMAKETFLKALFLKP